MAAAGDPTKIPGTDNIQAIARLGSRVLAVVSKGNGTELVKIDYSAVERVPDVTELVSTDDQTAVAYAATRTTEGGGALKGGIIYAETVESVRSLKLPNSWDVAPSPTATARSTSGRQPPRVAATGSCTSGRRAPRRRPSSRP